MANRKQDPKLVARLDKYEVYYISGKFRIPPSVVKAEAKKTGRSRTKLYEALRALGYTIPTKKTKKKK
jgi:hypothetical protein